MPAHYERTEEEEEFAQEDEAHACPTGICPVLRFRQHPGMHTVTRAVGQVRYGGPFEEIRDELLAAQNWEQRREILCFLRESAKKKDSRVIGLLRSPPPPPPPPSPPPPPCSQAHRRPRARLRRRVAKRDPNTNVRALAGEILVHQSLNTARPTPPPPPRRAARGRGPPPRTKWTRRVPHPVLIGHAASLALNAGGE
jgi:hypothetical protein